MNGNYPRYIGISYEKFNNNKNNKYQYFRVVGIKIENIIAKMNHIDQVINDVNHSHVNLNYLQSLMIIVQNKFLIENPLGYTKIN